MNSTKWALQRCTPLNHMRHRHLGLVCTLGTCTHPLWFSYLVAAWIACFAKMAWLCRLDLSQEACSVCKVCSYSSLCLYFAPSSSDCSPVFSVMPSSVLGRGKGHSVGAFALMIKEEQMEKSKQSLHQFTVVQAAWKQLYLLKNHLQGGCLIIYTTDREWKSAQWLYQILTNSYIGF